MKLGTPLFLFFFMMGASSNTHCQLTATGKARQQLYQFSSDQERLNSLENIGKFRNSLPADTLYHYAKWMKKLALLLNDKKRLALAEYNLLTGDLVKGKTDSVVFKIDNNTAFKDIRKTDTALYYKIQLLKANALNRANNRTAALDLQLKLLSEAEKESNTNAQLFALNYIGATYLNVGKPADARQAWLQGLRIIDEKRGQNNSEIAAYIHSNLALYYFNQYSVNKAKETADSFLAYINPTIEQSRTNENLGLLASGLSLRGNFYGLTGQFEKGESDIRKALAIRKEIGDPLYVMNDYAGLSSFYYSQRQYSKCVDAAREGIAMAGSNGIKGEQVQLMTIMGYALKQQGDYKQYSAVLEQYIASTAANNQQNAAEKIAEIQTRYEVQKKETMIAQQRLDLFRRNVVLYSAGIVAAILLFMLAYRFKKYQRIQKIKMAEMLEKEKLQQEIAVKNAGEKERKRIAAELHDNLGVQANAILHNSSLLNIQEAAHQTIVTDLQETAKEMLLNLRETLWAMKTSDVTATDLWFRIINFMKQMGRHYTGINFKLEGEVPENFIIPSSQALHIILVLQESVNNSVKHANATSITAASSKTAQGWRILLTDNGQGFDWGNAKNETDSYGLVNMQQRAREGNFEWNIETSIGNGTSTHILITSQNR